MKFTPKTAEEIAEGRLIKTGVYPFVVAHAVVKPWANSEATPKEDMVDLTITVYVEEKARVVHDYIGPWDGGEKLYRFCDAAGLMDGYKTGSMLSGDYVDAQGWLGIVINPPKDNPKTDWDAKPSNNIVSYWGTEEGAQKEAERLAALVEKRDAAKPRAVVSSETVKEEVVYTNVVKDDDIPF